MRLLRLLEETRLKPDGILRGPEAGMDERIRDTLNYVGANYKARLKVADLAKRVRMHAVHFNRLFRSMTGLSPNKYVLEKKIEKARDFMRLYGDQPNSTAIELGFHDYSHFFRTFKRLSGMTPSQYRAGLSSRT
jgi:AraC-like DNA-binding protein